MINILIFILILAIVGFPMGIFKKSNYINVDARRRQISLIRVGIALVAALFVMMVNPIRAKLVDVGYVGLAVNKLGDKKGLSKIEYISGLQFYNKWITDIVQVSTKQEHVDYPESLVITKGGFQCQIKPSFNVMVKRGMVADMYQSLRSDNMEQINELYLKTAVLGAVNDIANYYTVDSIFNYRGPFETEIVAECNKRMGKWFEMSQLRTNIVPPQSIVKAIEAKTNAIQEAQAAINKVATAEALAREKIAIAKGDSAEAVIKASGKAEAIRREQMFLTPMYIDFKRVERWNGANPTTVLGNSNGVIMQLPNNK